MDKFGTYEEPEFEINLADMLWDLLSQWKAILIVALIMALVVPGIKLLKDKKDYEAAVNEQRESAAIQASKSPEELVEEALTGLSEEDKATVLRLAKQQELISTQEAYLNDSLLMSGDLANQQQLAMQFYITVDDASILQPLADSYRAFMQNDSVLTSIGKALDPEADIKFIRELVSLGIGAIPDSNATGFIATASVILQPDANIDAIQAAVSQAMTECKDELTSAIGDHNLTLIDAEQTQTYNSTSMERRVSLTNGINTLLNSYATAVKNLTKDQQTALETINIINSGVNTQDKTTGGQGEIDAQIKVPSFSLKFALIGFAGGIILYAVVYSTVIISGKRVTSADELETYTGSRLLGYVFYAGDHKEILGKLLHSKLVDQRRYGRKGDITSQVAKVVSTVESVCEHSQASHVTMLCMGCTHGKADRIAQDVIADMNTAEITTNTVDASEELDEKTLLGVKNAVFVVSNSAKAPDVWMLTELCRSYDVERLGCIYLKEW